MKRLITLAIILMAGPVWAGTVNLAWDANTEPVTGYRIYMRTGAQYGTTPVWQGTGVTCTVTVVDDLQTAFVATAYLTGNIDGTIMESGHSNEVVYTPDSMKPQPPKSLRSLLIQAWNWLRKWIG